MFGVFSRMKQPLGHDHQAAAFGIPIAGTRSDGNLFFVHTNERK